MRKVLILVVVLGLTPVAAATMAWFSAGDGITYNASLDQYEIYQFTAGTVNITADFSVESMDVGAVTADNTDASVTNHGVTAVGSLNTKLTYRDPNSPGVNMADGNAQNIVIYQIASGVNLDNPDTPDIDESVPAAPYEVLYSFDVTAGAAGTTITIDDLIGPGDGAGDVNPYGTFPLATAFSSSGEIIPLDIEPLELVVIIPEPATVALLGLGMVVFLRRR